MSEQIDIPVRMGGEMREMGADLITPRRKDAEVTDLICGGVGEELGGDPQQRIGGGLAEGRVLVYDSLEQERDGVRVIETWYESGGQCYVDAFEPWRGAIGSRRQQARKGLDPEIAEGIGSEDGRKLTAVVGTHGSEVIHCTNSVCPERLKAADRGEGVVPLSGFISRQCLAYLQQPNRARPLVERPVPFRRLVVQTFEQERQGVSADFSYSISCLCSFLKLGDVREIVGRIYVRVVLIKPKGERVPGITRLRWSPRKYGDRHCDCGQGGEHNGPGSHVWSVVRPF